MATQLLVATTAPPLITTTVADGIIPLQNEYKKILFHHTTTPL
jgi:hypothetical protein